MKIFIDLNETKSTGNQWKSDSWFAGCGATMWVLEVLLYNYLIWILQKMFKKKSQIGFRKVTFK